jgi:glycine cleavage system H protein
MSKIPDTLFYSKEHEWVKVEENGLCTVGITDYAQSKLGDVVTVDLPKPGDRVEFMKEAANIESFKAVSEVYSPLSGEVVEVNSRLSEDPGAVNSDPYGRGWLFRVRPSNLDGELARLMKAEEYRRLVEGESA